MRHDDVQGEEFDWYAKDSENSFAIFCTAGGGLLPAEVVALIDDFNDLSESFEVRNWGSTKVWDDYAGLGLFVFDSDLSGRPYRRIREPSAVMPSDLRARLEGFSPLPRMLGTFRSSDYIDSWP